VVLAVLDQDFLVVLVHHKLVAVAVVFYQLVYLVQVE
jgi:hypothetical protein